MSRNYKINNPEGLYFLTFTVIGWIDVFTRIEYKDILITNLDFCQREKGLVVYAWVIMSNHIHLIASAKEGNLSAIIRDYKKFTSKRLLEAIQENPQESRKNWMMNMFINAGTFNRNNDKFQFWQQHSTPKECITWEFTQQKLEYLHNNPIKAGWVFNADDYPYSSACNYTGTHKGLLPVTLLY